MRSTATQPNSVSGVDSGAQTSGGVGIDNEAQTSGGVGINNGAQTDNTASRSFETQTNVASMESGAQTSVVSIDNEAQTGTSAMFDLTLGDDMEDFNEAVQNEANARTAGQEQRMVSFMAHATDYVSNLSARVHPSLIPPLNLTPNLAGMTFPLPMIVDAPTLLRIGDAPALGMIADTPTLLSIANTSSDIPGLSATEQFRVRIMRKTRPTTPYQPPQPAMSSTDIPGRQPRLTRMSEKDNLGLQ